jgi:hypothetical protein
MLLLLVKQLPYRYSAPIAWYAHELQPRVRIREYLEW